MMSKKKIIYIALAVLIVIAVVLGVVLSEEASQDEQSEDNKSDNTGEVVNRESGSGSTISSPIVRSEAK